MTTTVRIVALSFATVLLAVPAVRAAAEPTIYGSITNFTGKGKHPKSAVSGLIIDSRAGGRKFICYNYTIATSSKIKGQVSGVVDRITADGVERLGTFRSMNVLDFGSLPVPPPAPEGPCTPEFPGGPEVSGFGIATDCLETATQLEANDIIRWTFDFKKGAKLKGANAAVSIFGSVLPGSALGAAPAEIDKARRMAVGMVRLQAASR